MALLHRCGDVLSASRHDVVYVLREAFPFGPPTLERLLTRAAGRLIFDFDDAIYAPSLAYPNPLDRLRDWGKPAKLISIANEVVAGSEYLADYARQFAPSSRVSVLPTVVDPDVYRPAPASIRKTTVTIGWIGTPRGSGYLKQLLPVFSELSARHPAVRYRFVGAERFDAPSLPIEFKPWSLAEEVSDIQTFDIGIMPLSDDEETRGKCGFKLIQYMSVGVPPVCSPVGANLHIVQHGKTGFCAESSTDWLDSLMALVADSELRKHMGQAGRERAISHFSTGVMAPRLLHIIRRAAGRPRSGRSER
jgi:glycosyltransferase involved in cell wall biosynthesis